jgi:CubicO group peptidase (beta-lactamase class C family)
VMIIDDGVVVSQWGEISKPFKVHSIRKSFLSALYGTAVARREIDLYTTLEHLGVDDNDPSLTPEEKQARVIDLLKARSGIYHAALYESPAMKRKNPGEDPTRPARSGRTTIGISMRWGPSTSPPPMAPYTTASMSGLPSQLAWRTIGTAIRSTLLDRTRFIEPTRFG